MTGDVAIKVENLSKIFKLYDSPLNHIMEVFNPFGRKYHKDFYALRDVSFEVKKGETVGIIGHNGSGKSTLLKLLTGVQTPTSGSVTVNGRVSALLELGAGFNPELTGIENVYFNGTLMGFTREQIDGQLDEILSFADIGEYVYQPVKTYSSGMFIRLAFAVAVSAEPEILIVDEALSVGDMQFQKKCMDKMNEFRSNGITILFVSHHLYAIRVFCRRAILLKKGIIEAFGNSDYVVDKYIQEEFRENTNHLTIIKGLDSRAIRTHSTNIVNINYVKLVDIEGNEKYEFRTNDFLALEIGYKSNNKIIKPSYGMAVYSYNYDMPLRVTTNNSKWSESSPDYIVNDGIMRFEIDNLPLLPGEYSVWITIKDEHDIVIFDRIEDAVFFKVVGEDGGKGILKECGIIHYPGRWKNNMVKSESLLES